MPLPVSRPNVVDSAGRHLLIDLYEAAVAGAAPAPVTTAALAALAARHSDPSQRVRLFALGKGAAAMAGAAVTDLQRTLHVVSGGVVVAPARTPAPCATLEALVGDHPLPDVRSFAAAERIGQTATGMSSTDVAIVLMSGGASSLIAGPLPGMAGADLRGLFELLLGSGLAIREMNAVRKRFTRWGAGRLALALAPARTHVFVISDVPGDDPADVGSGPCAPDTGTSRDVVDLMKRSGIYTLVAPAMRDYLTGVSRGLVPETPRRDHPAFAHVSTSVIGTNRLAIDAVVARAAALGVPMSRASSPLTGDAAQTGERIAHALLSRAQTGERGGIVWGGETTVRLHASANGVVAPLGGRCQELALAAARVLARAGESARRVSLLAAGTDGRDGPTDAAGAFADADVWRAIAANGIDGERALAHHASYSALDAAGALLRRGLTGTNVMDVVIGAVD